MLIKMSIWGITVLWMYIMYIYKTYTVIHRFHCLKSLLGELGHLDQCSMMYTITCSLCTTIMNTYLQAPLCHKPLSYPGSVVWQGYVQVLGVCVLRQVTTGHDTNIWFTTNGVEFMNSITIQILNLHNEEHRTLGDHAVIQDYLLHLSKMGGHVAGKGEGNHILRI